MRWMWIAAAMLAGWPGDPGLADPAAQVVPAAYFTDNTDRVALADLRARDPATLTRDERAVLTAANRLGWIQIDGCNRGSNAILIRHDGRDAILTSRHVVAGLWKGQIFCAPDAAAVFYPNAAYISPDGAGAAAGFAYETIALEPYPLNFDGAGLMMGVDSDWVLYFLKEDVSDQPMPEGAWNAGEMRGVAGFSGGGARSGEAVVIGYDGRFDQENGWQFSYQPCRYLQQLQDWEPLYIDCDVSPGSSSSFLGLMEAGELRLFGMVSRASDPMAGTDVPVPEIALAWNQAVPAWVIRRMIDPDPARDQRPPLLLPFWRLDER